VGVTGRHRQSSASGAGCDGDKLEDGCGKNYRLRHLHSSHSQLSRRPADTRATDCSYSNTSFSHNVYAHECTADAFATVQMHSTDDLPAPVPLTSARAMAGKRVVCCRVAAAYKK